jgi:hypothetical protein
MKIIKIVLSMIFLVSTLYSYSMEDDINVMSKQSVKEILTDFKKGFDILLRENGGAVDITTYQKLTSVVVMFNPAIITWGITIDMEQYKQDLHKHITMTYPKNSNEYKQAMITLENGKVDKMLEDYSIKSTTNYSCSRKDYLYLFERGITMRYNYKETNEKFLNTVELDKRICMEHK